MNSPNDPSTPLTYSLPEAAAKLGGPFTVDFLKGHLAEIPHVKVGRGTGRGGRIGFSDSHLTQIVVMFTVSPAPGSEPGEFPSMVTRRGRRRATRAPVVAGERPAATAKDLRHEVDYVAREIGKTPNAWLEAQEAATARGDQLPPPPKQQRKSS